MLANPFDKEYEDRRKAQLEEQCRRPRAEVLREEQVAKQAQEILHVRRIKQRERRRLERLLGRPLPSAPSSSSVNTVHGETLLSSAENVPPLAGSTSWMSTAEATPGAAEPVDGALSKASDVVAATSAAVLSRRPRRTFAAGVLVRSSLMLAPITQSQRIQRRVDQILDELGVGIRPTPTAEICDEFDALRNEILVWMELQRLVKRKEEELRAVQERVSGTSTDRPPGSRRAGKRSQPAA
jgi:hypothetical protein